MSRLLRSDRPRDLFAGVARVAAGQALGRVLDLGILVLFGRLLGPAGLGAYLWGLALVVVLRTLASRGMEFANVRWLAVASDSGNREAALAALRRGERQALALSAGLAGAVVWALGTWPALLGASIATEHVPAVVALALVVPAATGEIMASAAMRGLGHVGTDVLVHGVARPALQLGIFLGLASRGGDPMWAAVWSFATACFVTLTIQAIWLDRRLRRDPAPAGDRDDRGTTDAPSRRSVLSYANHMWVIAILLAVLARGDRLVVTGALDAVTLGLLLTVLTVGQQFSFFLGALNNAFAPRIAAIHARGGTDQLDRELKVTTGWILYATLPLLVATAIATPEILGLFGEAFVTAWPALLVILLGQAVNVGTGSVGTALSMTGHQRIELLNLAALTLVGFAVLRYAASAGGLLPAAAAVAALTAAVNLVRAAQVRTLLGASPLSAPSVRALGSGVVLAGAGCGLRALTAVPDGWPWIAAAAAAAAAFMLSPVGLALLRLDPER